MPLEERLLHWQIHELLVGEHWNMIVGKHESAFGGLVEFTEDIKLLDWDAIPSTQAPGVGVNRILERIQHADGDLTLCVAARRNQDISV